MPTPYRLSFLAVQNVAHLAFEGVADGALLMEATRALYEDARWRYGGDVLWDFSRVAAVVLLKSELEALPAVDEAYRPVAGPGRDVLVAVREDDHLIAKLYQHMMRGAFRRVEVARSLAEGCALLGVPVGAIHDESDAP